MISHLLYQRSFSLFTEIQALIILNNISLVGMKIYVGANSYDILKPLYTRSSLVSGSGNL